MTAALAGLGTGALHALSGPDHLLGVAPHALACRRAAWRVGLAWGIGHGAGTAAVAAALLALASALDPAAIEGWAERGAGVALVALGVLALAALRRASPGAPSGTGAPRLRLLLAVGIVHGALGAAALVPVVLAASSPGLARALFLGGSWVGGAAAMAVLTAWLATVARSPRLAALLPRVPRLAAAASIAVGLAWLAR
jgi:hypothetical protein